MASVLAGRAREDGARPMRATDVISFVPLALPYRFNRERVKRSRILALDPGTKRIGVALSDEMGWIAQPLETFERRSIIVDLKHIQQLVHVHEVELWREVMRMTQAPKPELILQPQDHRHEGKDHIVERHSYNCGQFAGAKKEGEAKSEQRLQPKQRSEAEEDADRETERDGCRRGLDGSEAMPVRGDPALYRHITDAARLRVPPAIRPGIEAR